MSMKKSNRRLAIEPIRFYRVVTAGCQTQKPDIVKMTQEGGTRNRHTMVLLVIYSGLQIALAKDGGVYGNAGTTDPKNNSVG